MYRAYAIRASQGEHDNPQLLNRILELRRAKAELLGFRTFEDPVLDDRLAHTRERRRTAGLPEFAGPGAARSHGPHGRARRGLSERSQTQDRGAIRAREPR